MNPRDEAGALAHLILALREFRNDVVVIGGWAHRLSRLHPLSQAVDFEPLFSEDVDMALPAKLPPREEDLRAILQKAGFKADFVGENQPPVTHYRLGDEGAFYVEFLTPLVGRAKSGTRTIAGVTAQALRYLDILMVAPWSVFLREPEYPVGSKPVEVRIANATSYLVQKMLTLERRDANDQGKDILYVRDTLISFGGALAELRRLWNETVEPSMHPRVSAKLRGLVNERFSKVGDPVRRASRIAREVGRPASAEDIAEACRRGLSEVFATSRSRE
jgi:hypothetical protein